MPRYTDLTGPLPSFRNLPHTVKISSTMTTREFAIKNPTFPMEVLTGRSRFGLVSPRLRHHLHHLVKRRVEGREAGKAVRRGLSVSVVDLPTHEFIPCRYEPPARFSSQSRSTWRKDTHLAWKARREREIREKQNEERHNQYCAEKARKDAVEAAEGWAKFVDTINRNPSGIFYNGPLSKVIRFPYYMPGLTEEMVWEALAAQTAPTVTQDFRTLYDDLFAYKSSINAALAALKEARNNRDDFEAAAIVLVERFRSTADALKTLSNCGIDKAALCGNMGLGWDWGTMQWAYIFLRNQPSQLPVNVVTLLNCIAEVSELVGVSKGDLDAEAARQMQSDEQPIQVAPHDSVVSDSVSQGQKPFDVLSDIRGDSPSLGASNTAPSVSAFVPGITASAFHGLPNPKPFDQSSSVQSDTSLGSSNAPSQTSTSQTSTSQTPTTSSPISTVSSPPLVQATQLTSNKMTCDTLNHPSFTGSIKKDKATLLSKLNSRQLPTAGEIKWLDESCRCITENEFQDWFKPEIVRQGAAAWFASMMALRKDLEQNHGWAIKQPGTVRDLLERLGSVQGALNPSND
ncbi:hypothetical protein BU26DRAFT_550459 [Trematosphaeria pertusa]|uniref:Uncharacterized protein n=1 Tax=Trematosphaeria pertusa TaxID=390896 RepID=A0A6A6IJC3_9PLEO|nr:uncharacterized protein BU26DRAFT_550459 [Trematosphaeria pertusa]KAF2250277.1 hypothetical protein BU26DRAFT_550459 [Trematosphaeria pertusa]